MLNEKEILVIQEKIGYTFKDKELLNTAFVHSSMASFINHESNERLEFLGDSILNFITTEYLYQNFLQDEGHLSKAKAYLVSAKNLSKFIKNTGVIKFLHSKTFNPSTSENVMCDLFESILGAIYLDSKSIDTCKTYVIENLKYKDEDLNKIYEEMQDFKTKLQEMVQKNPKDKLEYVVAMKNGPAHDPQFTMVCMINGEEISKATSHSKKDAENKCAKLALEVLSNKN